MDMGAHFNLARRQMPAPALSYDSATVAGDAVERAVAGLPRHHCGGNRRDAPA
jgi:hypothetical protein